jgi:hypothetical protein
MYNYKVGYHSEEESGYVEMVHEKKFTPAEMEVLIADASVSVVGKKLELRPDDTHITFSDIYTLVAEHLCAHHGFAEVVYEDRFSAYGWEYLRLPRDGEDRCEKLGKLQSAVSQEFPLTEAEAESFYS